MAHPLPLILVAADGDAGVTPGVSVAADAEDEEVYHHQRLEYHPQRLVAFHHQRQAVVVRRRQTLTSGSTIGTTVTLAGKTWRGGITAKHAPKTIVKGHQEGCTKKLCEAYLAAGHRPSKSRQHKTVLPTNPQENQA